MSHKCYNCLGEITTVIANDNPASPSFCSETCAKQYQKQWDDGWDSPPDDSVMPNEARSLIEERRDFRASPAGDESYWDEG